MSDVTTEYEIDDVPRRVDLAIARNDAWTVMKVSFLLSVALGIAMVIDGLINTKDSGLVFRPLDPPLEASMSLIWKKYQVFTPAAEAFLTALQEAFEA